MKKFLNLLLVGGCFLLSSNVFAASSLPSNTSIVNTIQSNALSQQNKQSNNLIIESVRVGYSNDIPIIKTPKGKVISIIDNLEFSSIPELLKQYTNAMNIDKIDILIIKNLGDYGFQFLDSLLDSTDIVIDKVYTNINIDENASTAELNKKILNYYKDKIVEIEDNKDIELEDDLTIKLIAKEHKNYYTNSDYYELSNVMYGTVVKYKNNEISWINNNPWMEEFNQSIRKEQQLDCDVAIFKAQPRFNKFEEDVNLFDATMMKTITPQHVLVQYTANDFKGYDTNTNAELNQLTNIINSGGAKPYYSYKFNSRTTIECNGTEGGIIVKQEQIPRTIM